MGGIGCGQPADYRRISLQAPTEFSGILVAPFASKIHQHGAGGAQGALPPCVHNLSGRDCMRSGDGGKQGSKGDSLRASDHLTHRGGATIRFLDKTFVPEKPLIHRLIEAVLMPLCKAVLYKPPIGLSRGADLPMKRSQDGLGAHLHRTGSPHIGGMTAPSVCPRAHWFANPDGVEMEIPHQFQEIGFTIAQDGLIPPLKNMATLVVAAIVVLTISELKCLHRTRQRLIAYLQQEMHMIDHQHIGMQRDTVAMAIAF